MPSSYRKTHAFYTYDNDDDDKLSEWLESQTNKADFIKQSMIDIKNGKLKNMETDDKEVLEIKKLKAYVRKLEAEAKIKEHYALHIETFGSYPSKEGEEAIKNRFKPQIGFRIDKKNCIFSCPKCPDAFRWGNVGDLSDKIQKFVNHWYETHHGDPPEDVTWELSKLSESLRDA